MGVGTWVAVGAGIGVEVGIGVGVGTWVAVGMSRVGIEVSVNPMLVVGAWTVATKSGVGRDLVPSQAASATSKIIARMYLYMFCESDPSIWEMVLLPMAANSWRAFNRSSVRGGDCLAAPRACQGMGEGTEEGRGCPSRVGLSFGCDEDSGLRRAPRTPSWPRSPSGPSAA